MIPLCCPCEFHIPTPHKNTKSWSRSYLYFPLPAPVFSWNPENHGEKKQSQIPNPAKPFGDPLWRVTTQTTHGLHWNKREYRSNMLVTCSEEMFTLCSTVEFTNLSTGARGRFPYFKVGLCQTEAACCLACEQRQTYFRSSLRKITRYFSEGRPEIRLLFAGYLLLGQQDLVFTLSVISNTLNKLPDTTRKADTLPMFNWTETQTIY